MWKWVNLTNKSWFIFGLAKDLEGESNRPKLSSQCTFYWELTSLDPYIIFMSVG